MQIWFSLRVGPPYKVIILKNFSTFWPRRCCLDSPEELEFQFFSLVRKIIINPTNFKKLGDDIATGCVAGSTSTKNLA